VAFGMELTLSTGTLMASVSPGASYNEFGQPMQPSKYELEQAIENASEYADIYLELD